MNGSTAGLKPTTSPSSTFFLKAGSGLGELQHIASYERPPERVVLKNYATDAMRDRCKQLGAAEVFDKSTEIEQLVDWLATRVRH